jgi:uncharacterized protein (TIGR03437 family)
MLRRIFALPLFWAALVFAQPSVYYRGIVNVASYSPAGLPNGSIAQGSVFALFGSNIGPSQSAQVSSFPLATTLAGVSITVSQGSTQVNALPVYVSAGQINALMPSNAPLGQASVRVQFNNGKSNNATVNIVAASFGIFAANSAGSGPGIVQDATLMAQPINSPTQSAHPGDTMILWGTGLGPVTFPDNVAPTAGSLSTPTEVFVGGVSATVTYNGRSPCCSGTDQIVFIVPSNAPLGCWVPVYVRTNGTLISNVVTMAIGAKGGTCTDSNPAAAFIQGGKLGAVQLIRSSTHEDIGTIAPVDVADDFVNLDLSQTPGGAFPFAALFSAPPPGTCTVLAGSGDFWHSFPSLGAPVSAHLDAGAVSLRGPRGTMAVTPAGPSGYGVFLGSYAPFIPGLLNQLYLDPGNYIVTASGGADVGAFTATITQPAAFTWTNRDQISPVSRSLPLTLMWSGLPATQQMAILGGESDLPSNSSAVFYCVAPAGATSFTIPASILSALPATRARIFKSKGVIYLTNVLPANGVPFTASGLDAAFALGGYVSGTMVMFQ